MIDEDNSAAVCVQQDWRMVWSKLQKDRGNRLVVIAEHGRPVRLSLRLQF
jgi:hypothetical protein